VRIVLRKLVGKVNGMRAVDGIGDVDHVALGWMKHDAILIDDVHRRVLVVRPDRRGKAADVEDHLNIGGVHLVEYAVKPCEVELIFCRLKRVPGEVAHADERKAGLLHQSYVAMNLFRRAVDGLIAGADEELTMAGPVRMFGGAWGRALGSAGGKEESTAQKHRGKEGESFQGGFLLLMHCGGKFRCRISGQNGIPEGSHLVIPSRAGINFVS
jgi:hypothetical protein